MIDIVCVFMKEGIIMNESIIFTKSKEELYEKADFIINEVETSEIHKKSIKRWIEWFKKNYDKINLENLNETDYFYRIYWNIETNMVGIQKWKDADVDLVVWEENLYVSKPDVLDGEQTIVLE